MCGQLTCIVADVWQLMCMVITIWWKGPPHMWPINVHSSSCVAIKMHGNYYMLEGTPHVWPINMHGSSHVEINMHSNY